MYSYLTIEKRGPIPEPLRALMGRQVFGCDICQDVCPWNRRAPVSEDAELAVRAELVNPALAWLAELDAESFRRLFRQSPVQRTKLSGLLRNVAIAMGNSGLSELRAQATGVGSRSGTRACRGGAMGTRQRGEQHKRNATIFQAEA